MRQEFSPRGGYGAGRKNLPILRQSLIEAGLDGLYLPHADEYRNEYQPEASKRLEWATGFSGSAGAAWIFADEAVLFVDGRYELQAKAQAAPELFTCLGLEDPGPFDWLAEHKGLSGARLGYDLRLLSRNGLEQLQQAASKAGAKLIADKEAILDRAWSERPAPPASLIYAHPDAAAGVSGAQKRAQLAADLQRDGLDAVVLTSPASLAWLFNIRGSDVRCTPLILGRAIIHADGRALLLLNPEAPKAPELGKHLGAGVRICPLPELETQLAKLAGLRVGLDPDLAPAWFFETLNTAGAKITPYPDPCELPRACKNATEIEGAKQAHLLDGIAMCRFLHWLEETAPSGTLTEIDAVRQLETYREDSGKLRDIAFETIAGAGANGAIIHYRVDENSNARLKPGLFLVDSGGQYQSGTTDITRTVAIGEPEPEMRRLYTLVLKGHIALARVRFPENTCGSALDTLARLALWEAGLDYDHGTGHGVGSFLGVHEGPQRIAKRHSQTKLLPGMILSNEPGYYRSGGFGIRLENLQYVTAAAPISGGERNMLGFATLTMAPYDGNLIDIELLDRKELDFVNTYHQKVLETVSPHLEPKARLWLKRACMPI